MVIEPHTQPVTNKDRAADYKRQLRETFSLEGKDLGPLIDRFVDKNMESATISLPSNAKRGYVIDYNREQAKCVENNPFGWDDWFDKYPKTFCFIYVSRPVYDAANGLLLIYIGRQSSERSGIYYIALYEYKEGKFKELKIDEQLVS